ncbi:MAG: S-layer homology domain-containing protein [Peptococcaceae bacterium]
MSRRFLSFMTMIICFVLVLSLGINTKLNIGEAAKKLSLTKIESIDKKAVIKCSKGTFMVKDGVRIDGEIPSVTTEVYFSQIVNNAIYQAHKNHTFASDIFKISVSDGAYRLSEQGELTFTYHKSISKLATDRLSVWYSEKQDNFNSGCTPMDNCLGGYVNPGKHTITVPFQLKGEVIYYAVLLDQREPAFKDDWSYSYVMPLWSKEIMKTSNQNISEDIKRREFAFIMVRGLGLPLIGDINSTFYDVYNSDEDFSFIETAARYGIINGFPNKDDKPLFKPDSPLTREQAATIIARVANLKLPTDVDKAKKDLEKIFPDDGSKISPWAALAVLAVYKAKFIEGDKINEQGKVTTFRPDGHLKRSEAAKITYLLLKKLKKI